MNRNTNEKLSRFVELLEGIFELDKADLDFGIYRIMNIRKDEIKRFLSDGLPKKVQEALTPFAAETEAIEARIAEIEKQCDNVGVEISKSKMAGEYASLKSQIITGTDLSALETDVYAALYSFFNRYYDEGDFISKRRYKKGVYAIPYEGEEVKLYWANADQYYIKTAENFRDYTFIVDDKKVHFRLVDATCEKNNNKESNGNGRIFMLYRENPNRPDIKTMEEIDGELVIRFVYDIPEDKNKRRKDAEDENLTTISGAIQKDFKDWLRLLAPATSSKNETRSLLQKHLTAYVAKNTFDYFIHKDLNGFLTRELDFFIKSEVIYLEDIDTVDEKRADCFLAKVRAIKRVGKIIIEFLSQIEEFQKKLWLKKKFVVETNWCVTLDRIDESFYTEIIENAAQIAEWRDMYAIDEIQGDLSAVRYSDPLTVEFLRQNGNLVLDTKYFSADFKDRLVASIDNLDEQTGGLLIHSENFQALQLLTDRYKEQVKCVYIDPPYNAQSSEILYKNTYKHSSWMSLIKNRVDNSIPFLRKDFVYTVAIDEVEQERIGLLLKQQFYDGFAVTCVTIVHNPSGQQGDNFSSTHEYAYFVYSVPGRSVAEQVRDDPNEWDTRNLRDVTGEESLRAAAKTCFYPVLIKDNKIIGFGDVCDNDYHPQMNEIRADNVIEVYPIDPENIERKWRFSRDTVETIKDQLFVSFIKNRNVYDIKRLKKAFNYKTVWQAAKYSANNYGTQPLNQMFGYQPFSYPKSINTVYDCISAGLNGKNDALILDYFAGSGTTGHAVINLNRQDKGNRKYILVEMGEYFDTVTLPRMKKAIYSADWKKGKPQNRNTGISHIMKYFTLESYEDALSNITFDNDKRKLSLKLGYEYMMWYMFDYETKDSMLNLDLFSMPFDYKLKINENNETKEKIIDLCETFNYLLGLSVIKQSTKEYFIADNDPNGEYENAVRLEPNKGGEFVFKRIEGKLPDGRRAIVIWRTITDDLLQSNAALDAYFSKRRSNFTDCGFDLIFVNGDNNLEILRRDNEIWKVHRIEPVFKAKMFEGAE